ncbi:MAG: hypothetical protein H0W63_03975 [Gemmatimonadaceae bacterium]|nr:hypothetical protein [Gemmatimonadaceae bacterium]
MAESRPQRWAKALAEAQAKLAAALDAKTQLDDAIQPLAELAAEYQEWRDNLPENLVGSNLCEKLDAITSLDFEEGSDLEAIENTLQEAEDAELPLGFGRD